MLSGREKIPQPSPPHARAEGRPKTVPDGRREADLCEPIQNTGLHDIVRSARTGPSESSHEHTLIECEKRIFEIGELEQGVLDLQPSTHSSEQRLILRTSESHPRSSGVEEEEDGQGVSDRNLEEVSKDTPPRDAGSGDVLHGPEAAREMENPGPRQSPGPPSSPSVTPSALPLHLIPLLPQKSPSSKRQRRSIGLSSNQTDKVADDFSGRGGSGLPNVTGGTSPSPQSLRSRLQNFSSESAGISRTLAYAMDQMDATHSSDYLPPRSAELEKLVMTREAEVDREGDVATTRPKTVRFEESTCQPAELAERLWADALQAAVTARTHEESEQKMERATQSDEQDEGVTCAHDATVGAGGKREISPEEDAGSFLRKLGAVTLGTVEERQSEDATWEIDAMARCATTEGELRTVDPEVGRRVEDVGSEAELATLALKPAQLQEYIRLKEREVELRNAEAETRIFEERLEARENDLMNRLGTVRQRLEAIRQRRASINHQQEEILRKKLEAVTKQAQGSANALGADAPPESS